MKIGEVWWSVVKLGEVFVKFGRVRKSADSSAQIREFVNAHTISFVAPIPFVVPIAFVAPIPFVVPIPLQFIC